MKMSSNKGSLRVRYLFKLFTNVIGIPISLITESLIPRGLGSKLYGDFSFISGFFKILHHLLILVHQMLFMTKYQRDQMKCY